MPTRETSRSAVAGLVVALTSGVCLLLASCGMEEEGPDAVLDKPAAAPNPEVLAMVGSESVTAKSVKALLASASRSLPSTDVAKLVDDMITSEVLYREALRVGLDREPETHRSIQRLLTQRLLERQVEQPEFSRRISDAELREYFDRHREDYTWPEQMRLADIFIAIPSGATGEQREAVKKRALLVLEEARNRRRDRFGLSRLIREYSDEHPQYAIGDTGFFDREGRPLGLDKTLVEAAFSLSRNGQLADKPVETAAGYHVIMRVGHKAARNKEYKDLVHQLRSRIRRERIEQARRSYIDSLRSKAEIRVMEHNIVRLEQVLTSSVNADREDGRGDEGRNNPVLVPQ